MRRIGKQQEIRVLQQPELKYVYIDVLRYQNIYYESWQKYIDALVQSHYGEPDDWPLPVSHEINRRTANWAIKEYGLFDWTEIQW